MLAITTTFEHIGHWIKMRQSLARFSEPESSPQIRPGRTLSSLRPSLSFRYTQVYGIAELAFRRGAVEPRY